MTKYDFINADNKWDDVEERRLIRLIVKGISFDEISEILRSPRAVKLRFCLILDRINWNDILIPGWR